MAASKLPRGLILDLVTPLKPGGDLDEKGLGRLLNRVVPYVQGILIAGPCGGEGDKLPSELREELLHRVSQTVRAKLPLMVWLTRPSPEATFETAGILDRRLKKDGYHGDVFWVDTPLYYQGNRGLFRHYTELIARFNRGWVLHNDPALIKPLKRPFNLKRQNIRTNILKNLCTLKGMEGIIFSGSLEREQNYQKAVRSASEFMIYDGEESRFLNHPSLSGVVSIGANLAPRGWQRIVDSSLNPDANRDEYPDRLRQIWETGANLSDLIALYEGGSVPLIKAGLAGNGILESPLSHRGEANPQKQEKLLKWMETHPALLDRSS